MKFIKSYKENIDKIKNFLQTWQGKDDLNDIEDISQYNLDYIPKGTFPSQQQSYFSYQYSEGDQLTEEFRFFCDKTQMPYKIEFWLSEWSKNENKILKGEDCNLMLEFFNFLKEQGDVEEALQRAPWKD